MMIHAEGGKGIERRSDPADRWDGRRFVPLETISAALLEDDRVVAHGIVSNISERGACLITNTPLEPGRTVKIQLRTKGRTELFDAEARVVWSGEGLDPASEIVGGRIGATFINVSQSKRETMVAILENSYFQEVGAPETSEDRAIHLRRV
jgi:hypothetical protein